MIDQIFSLHQKFLPLLWLEYGLLLLVSFFVAGAILGPRMKIARMRLAWGHKSARAQWFAETTVTGFNICLGIGLVIFPFYLFFCVLNWPPAIAYPCALVSAILIVGFGKYWESTNWRKYVTIQNIGSFEGGEGERVAFETIVKIMDEKPAQKYFSMLWCCVGDANDPDESEHNESERADDDGAATPYEGMHGIVYSKQFKYLYKRENGVYIWGLENVFPDNIRAVSRIESGKVQFLLQQGAKEIDPLQIETYIDSVHDAAEKEGY